jgi:glyoxylase-like metal-dependent hydrolase (beta-lactamase superfamily II)
MTVTATSVRGRRWFLVQAGRGVLGFAVLGLAAACSGDDGDETDVAGALAPSGSAAGLDWWRVDFAYVSAYVRGREAALVDCGLGSRVEELEAVLEAAGTGWDRLRHVLITHAHGDHFDGLIKVARRSPGAALYAGAADAESIQDFSGRRLRTVADGQEVFGLQVVETPGHTPGHIAVFDPESRLLVAGDALNNTIDGLRGPMPEFTADKGAAAESVRKLAALEPEVILCGHGPPVQQDAAAQLRRLAGSQ